MASYERYIKFLSKKLHILEKRKFLPQENTPLIHNLIHQIKATLHYLHAIKKKKKEKDKVIAEQQEQSQKWSADFMRWIKQEQQKLTEAKYTPTGAYIPASYANYPYAIELKLKPNVSKNRLDDEILQFSLELLSQTTEDQKPIYKATDLDFAIIEGPNRTLSFRFSNKVTAELFIARLIMREFIAAPYVLNPNEDANTSLNRFFTDLKPLPKPKQSVKKDLGDDEEHSENNVFRKRPGKSS